MTETSRISDQLRQIREEAGLSVRMLAARRLALTTQYFRP